MKGMSAGYLVLAVLVAGLAFAEAACFCLGDAYDALWYDCQTYHVELNPNPQYKCRPNPEQDRVHVMRFYQNSPYANGC